MEPAAAYNALAKAAGGRGLPLPGFKRDNSGNILSCLPNAIQGVLSHEACGYHVAYDGFRDEIMLSTDGTNWWAMADGDAVQLRVNLENLGFLGGVGKEMMRDALAKAALVNEFDSAQRWLEALPAWDGVLRCETFFHTHFSAEDSPYARAVGRYAWSVLAGRIMDPGCKADMVPILVGVQGTGKSEGIKLMVPGEHEEFYAEIGFHEKEDDMARKMRGTLIVELAELKGLNSRDSETIKAWVTRRWEKWTPKFKEFQTRFSRRCLLMGSTNADAFLADDTGERRWLPLKVGRVRFDMIRADRDQLWAEALFMWRLHGVDWREAQGLATEEHEQYKLHDPWEEPIKAWLAAEDVGGSTVEEKGYITIAEVLRGAIGLSTERIDRRAELRGATVLRALGFQKRDQRADGHVIKAWWREMSPFVALRSPS